MESVQILERDSSLIEPAQFLNLSNPCHPASQRPLLFRAQLTVVQSAEWDSLCSTSSRDSSQACLIWFWFSQASGEEKGGNIERRSSACEK
jgi:hypothetical protein